MSLRTDNGARPKSINACSSEMPRSQEACLNGVQRIENGGSCMTDGCGAVLNEAEDVGLVEMH
eukprot:10610886-Alexandrium_andersonii.AAC.1